MSLPRGVAATQTTRLIKKGGIKKGGDIFLRFENRDRSLAMPHDTPPKPPENREMYNEIAALVASIGKAFGRPESEVIAALEKNAIAVDFGRDENGNRFVLATFEGKTARLYQGAIKQEPEQAGSAGDKTS